MVFYFLWLASMDTVFLGIEHRRRGLDSCMSLFGLFACGDARLGVSFDWQGPLILHFNHYNRAA